MSKTKDAMFTDTEREKQEQFEPDPEYDRPPANTLPQGTGIFSKISAIMSEIDAISKSQKNLQQRFRYRGIDDVYNALHAVMAKHKVFTTSEILYRDREERQTKQGGTLLYTTLRVRYTFWAEDGSSVFTVVDGEGMDSGDKSSNKAMAVAHKYALLQIFMIPTEDAKDPDAESHEVVSKHNDWHRSYDKRTQADTFQKPTPNPDVIRALLACEDLKTLQEMWNKLSKSEHKLYEGVKEQRKNELQTKEADEQQKDL